MPKNKTVEASERKAALGYERARVEFAKALARPCGNSLATNEEWAQEVIEAARHLYALKKRQAL